MKKISLIIIYLLLVTACSRAQQEALPDEPRTEGDSILFAANAPELSSIQSQVITMQPVPPMHLNGRVTWNEDKTVRIYTPFAGRVERILAQPGETVKKGQPLAVIASPDFGQAQADARRAESDYALAEKNLARL